MSTIDLLNMAEDQSNDEELADRIVDIIQARQKEEDEQLLIATAKQQQRELRAKRIAKARLRIELTNPGSSTLGKQPGTGGPSGPRGIPPAAGTTFTDCDGRHYDIINKKSALSLMESSLAFCRCCV